MAEEEDKFAKPDSIAFRSFYFQKRRKKRRPRETQAIEFITSNDLILTTSNGETLTVQG